MDSEQNRDGTGEKPVYQEAPGGHFASGNPGRPKGIRDRRVREGEIVAGALLDLPKCKERVKKLLEDPDTEPRVFVDMYKFLHEQRYGKALQRVDVDVRGAAESLAEQLGIESDALITLATQIAAAGAAGSIQ